MVSFGLAAITVFPFASSWAAAKSAWKSAKTVWSISITSVSGWKFAMVSWPKLAANTNVSPLAPVAAGAADAVCVVAPAWVPLVAESAAVGWGLVATGLARPLSSVAVAVGWLLVGGVRSGSPPPAP